MLRAMKAHRVLPIFILPLLLLACTGAPADNSPASEEPALDATPTDSDSSFGQFGGTAWRSKGEDGATYVTYLDDDGMYRDIRDGVPYQTGKWTTSATADGETTICMQPGQPSGPGGCWTAGKLGSDGELDMDNGAGKRIALTQTDYAPPSDPSASASATPQSQAR